MQRVNNMGSLLQAYALKSILESLNDNVDVEFIDIDIIKSDYELLESYQKDFRLEREDNGIIGKLKKINKYTINRFKLKKLSKKQNEIFEKFRSEVLKIERTSDCYDLCIIGSDEVFNCAYAGAWGFTSQLFGNVKNAKKVALYAASCGATKYTDLPINVVDKIKKAFANVTNFSVRDANTHEFVRKLTDERINDNLDPVLIYDFEQEMAQSKLPKLPERYCVIYSYYNRIHDKNEIRKIDSFCRKHQMIPVAVGAPQFWIKNYIICTPFQCLKIFQNASFVVTDTFHGTIFSAKYANKYAIMVRKSNQNKLLDLVKRIAVEKHVMSRIEDIDNMYDMVNDKKKFESIIGCETVKATAYLKECLKA